MNLEKRFWRKNEIDKLIKKKNTKSTINIENIKNITKYNPENITAYDLGNIHKDITIDNNENIIFKEENLNFIIYEKYL